MSDDENPIISATHAGFLVTEPVPLSVVTDRYLKWVLSMCDGNRTKAAEMADVCYPVMRKHSGPRYPDTPKARRKSD